MVQRWIRVNRICGCICMILFLISSVPPGAFAQKNEHAKTSGQTAAVRPYGYMQDAQIKEGKNAASANLEKMVRLKKGKQKLISVLKSIAHQAGLELSYSEQFVPLNMQVEVKETNVTAKKALWNVLDGTSFRFGVSSSGQLVLLNMQRKKQQPEKQKVLDETISGTVIDASNGQTLPGVNVIVKGTSRGTATSQDGSYELSVSSLQDTLVFSYIGYQTKRVPIDGRTSIDVSLSKKALKGGEVVVVGYGTQESKEVTGAITNIDTSAFNKGQINDAAGLIQGKVAGLSIVKPGSDPNGGYSLRLRGISTLGANQEPLIVVDGVPGASLQSVDPNDIKSIDVLKDASASAIYGTRGSNGVIIITTKTGSSSRQKPSFNVEYKGSTTMNTPYRKVEVLGAQGYKDMISYWKDYTGTDYSANDLGHSNNWFDLITQQGISQEHNIALSGGDNNTNYRASLNYRNVRGILKHTGFDRINGRLNLNQHTLDNNLVLNLHLSTSRKKSQFGFPQAFRYATIFKPTAPIYDSSMPQYGGYFQQDLFDLYNPVSIIEQNTNEGQVERLDGSLKAEYDFSDFISGLSISGFYAEHRTTTLNGSYYPSTGKWVGIGRNGLANKNEHHSTDQLIQSTAHYINTIADELDLEALAGYSKQDFVDSGFNASGGDFITDHFGYKNLGAARDFPNGLGDVGSYELDHQLAAYFGRLNLNFQDTYLLSGSLRREFSSRFGKNNKWGTFWSVNGGLQLATLFDIPYTQELKLRAGYGVTGQDAPSSYLSLLRFGPQGSFLVNGQWVPSYGPASNPNPDLKWEKKLELNIGVDFSMFDSKLTGSVDWYSNHTKDLLLNFPVPVPPNLYNREWINIGELGNKGLELSLNYQAVQNKALSWKTGVTFSRQFRSRIVTLSNDNLQFGNTTYLNTLGSPGLTSHNIFKVTEGGIIGNIWGPVYQGIKKGHWQLKDMNGDGSITEDDFTTIGNGLPKGSFGWSNTMNYKNWDLSFFFRGIYGHDLINTYRVFYQAPEQIGSYNVLKSTWDIKTLTDPPKFSSYQVENASFLKLDNAALGYTFDLKNFPLSKLRVYASGQNLFVITNYSGPDPAPRYTDSQDSGDGPLVPGVDRRNTWFTSRRFSVGVDIKF